MPTLTNVFRRPMRGKSAPQAGGVATGTAPAQSGANMGMKRKNAQRRGQMRALGTSGAAGSSGVAQGY